MTPARRALLAAVCVNLAGVLPLFMTGAMAVQIGRDLHVDASGIGWILACFALVSFACSAPVGARVGAIGISRSLRLAASLSSIALVGCAVSPSAGALGAAALLAGLGNAFGQTSSNALVAARVPSARFGLAYAVKQSAIPLSILLGGLAVPLIALTIHWRAAYVLAAAFALWAVRLVPARVVPSEGRAEQRVSPQDRVSVWLLGFGLVAAVIASTSLGAHAAASAVAVGFDEATAGALVALGGLAGLAVRLAAGVRADRVRTSALAASAVLIAIGAAGWLLMASLLPVAFVVGLLAANAFGWGWPGLVHLAVARRFPEATAAASGIVQTGVALGLLIGPPLTGLVAVSAGWNWAWLVAAAAALVGATLILVARRQLAVTSATA